MGFQFSILKNTDAFNEKDFVKHFNKCYFNKDSTLLLNMFTQLENELQVKRKLCLIYAQNLIANIIIELYRKICSETDQNSDVLPQKSPNDDYAYIISSYFSELSKSGKTDFSLKELADTLFMSERQLSRYLLKHYNKTFVSILNETKIEYIKFMLTTSNMKIEEIAEKCCWSTKYLYKRFKSETGTSPNKYISGQNVSKERKQNM